MVFQFNPFVFGLVVIVGVATAIYTYRQQQASEYSQQYHYQPRWNAIGRQDDDNESVVSDIPYITSSEEKESCIICFKTISKSWKTLECNHRFHEYCINKWLKESNTCPICRRALN